MAKIRMSRTWVCAFVFALLLLLLLQTPRSAAARSLRDGSGSIVGQETYRPDERVLKWSDEQAGDDGVPTPPKLEDNDQFYNQQSRFLTAELHADYTEPAANPSIPYTGVP